MNPGLKTYWYDRAGLVLLLLIFFSLSTWLIPNQYERWVFVLLTTTAISFTHFFVGWFYQLKSFKRTDSEKRRYRWFWVLILATLASAWLFFVTGQVLTFFLLVVAYFMIHGYFNEFTLYKNSTGQKADPWFIASITAVLTGLIFVSLNHPSSLLSEKFEYLIVNDFMAELILNNSALVALGQKLGLFCFVLAGLVELVAVCKAKQNKKYHWLALVLIIFVAYAVFQLVQLNYIFVVCSILLYHFLIWFWQYFRRFKEMGGQPLKQYILVHAVILLPFSLILLGGTIQDWMFTHLLTAHVTLTLTAAHVSTSFMSESWFRKHLLKES